MQKLTEGQRLFWISANYNSRGDVTVLKVGRKWAQLNNHERIDVKTLIADNGQCVSPGRCYLSRADYEASATLKRAWRNFIETLRHQDAPEGVTVADIEAAMKLLRISTEN